MDYGSVIKFLNNTYSHCVASHNYYQNIALWNEWYKGSVSSFHTTRIYNGINAVTLQMFKLGMAKRVCEDWASSTFNERADITINSGASKNTSSIFIQGSKMNSGVLGSNNFNVNMSIAAETMFALGTSAIVISLDNILVDSLGNVLTSQDGSIALNFCNALSILPISSSNGVITECAFVTEDVYLSKRIYKISTHIKESDGYVIYNTVLDTNYRPITDNGGVLPVIRTKSSKPLFFIMKPNIANNIDLNSALGLSVYANSIDVLKSIDHTYDACVRDIVTGQRLIFMNRKLLTQDDSGVTQVPQDIKQSYMQFFGDEVGQVDEYIKDFSPTFRTEQLDKELQNQLNILSNNCGLGTKYYQFEAGGVVTATEYVGERNDFMRNVKKHSHMFENVIKELVLELLWVGKNILGQNVNPDSKVSVKLSDGVIEDDNKEKEADRLDVKDGIMSKAEFRAKWYGETLEEAQSKIDSISGVSTNIV